MAYNLRTSFYDLNVGQKGSSAFATIEEIKEQYKCIPLSDYNFDGLAGFPVAMIDNCFYIDTSNTNALIIGMTRSGKGEMFVRTVIDIAARSEEKPSLIIPDLKLELSSSSYSALKEAGYIPLIFNVEDPSIGIQFNPLSLAIKNFLSGNKDDAELLCNSFAYSIYAKKGDNNNNDSNNDFFLSNATHALSALIIAHITDCDEADKRENAKAQVYFIKAQQAYEKITDEQLKQKIKNDWENNRPDIYTEKNLKKFKYIPSDVNYVRTQENIKKVTVPSICHTFSDLAQDWIDSKTTKLDIYFSSRPDTDRAKYIYSSIGVSGGERTKGSIFSQALTKLDLYMYQNIIKLTSQSTIDLVLLSINISMTVNARDIRQQEAENALDSALEGTISTLSKNTYSINNQEEYIADLVMALTEQIQSDSSVTIRVLDTDYDKGIMSIQVTETYKHINGKTGNVVTKKTVILEDKEHQDINNDVNMYTIQYLYPDNSVYKYMQVSEGTSLNEPVNPYPEKNVYWTSDNAVVSFPFIVNSDKIIKININ